jgi:hypothetical protein
MNGTVTQVYLVTLHEATDSCAPQKHRFRLPSWLHLMAQFGSMSILPRPICVPERKFLDDASSGQCVRWTMRPWDDEYPYESSRGGGADVILGWKFSGAMTICPRQMYF